MGNDDTRPGGVRRSAGSEGVARLWSCSGGMRYLAWWRVSHQGRRIPPGKAYFLASPCWSSRSLRHRTYWSGSSGLGRS